jgi:hypothetical protein
VSDTVPAFYEFEDYARLVEAAGRIDARTLVVILLRGDAGLRRGEIDRFFGDVVETAGADFVSERSS